MRFTVDKAEVILEICEAFEHVWDMGLWLNGIETLGRERRLITYIYLLFFIDSNGF
jgi:hypothetical protein